MRPRSVCAARSPLKRPGVRYSDPVRKATADGARSCRGGHASADLYFARKVAVCYLATPTPTRLQAEADQGFQSCGVVVLTSCFSQFPGQGRGYVQQLAEHAPEGGSGGHRPHQGWACSRNQLFTGIYKLGLCCFKRASAATMFLARAVASSSARTLTAKTAARGGLDPTASPSPPHCPSPAAPQRRALLPPLHPDTAAVTWPHAVRQLLGRLKQTARNAPTPRRDTHGPQMVSQTLPSQPVAATEAHPHHRP